MNESKTKKRNLWIVAGLVLAAFAWSTLFTQGEEAGKKSAKEPVNLEGAEVAYLAGGCFWCVEADFEKLDGVVEAVSGYMGGPEENPTYKQVAGHKTGHREAVAVYYDPAKVSYDRIVEYLIQHIDPTDAGGSFYDRGHSYTSAIYARNDEEKKIAKEVIQRLDEQKKYPKPIVTPVEDAGPFWRAEEYHQDYYLKNPAHYWAYRKGSGRDAYVKRIWGE